MDKNTNPAPDDSRFEAMSKEYGMAFIAAVTHDMLDPALVADLPVDWARSNRLLPVRMDGRICVLTADPEQVSQQEYLSLLIGEELEPLLATEETILSGIERCYYSKEDSPEDFIHDMALEETDPTKSANKADDLLAVAQKAPVTQLINLILLEAVKKGASDIHFEPFLSRLRVRYRVDGVLYEQSAPPKHMEETLVSRLKVMARLDIAEKRLPQDGMARVRVGEREIDIRVATVPVAEGERVVLRLLDRDSALLPLDVLGMSADMLVQFRELVTEPHGMVVVCGPTGSGKTTTLYAALSQLDSSRKNIMTIEEPIEYQLPDIGQIQVKPKIGLTFASGLRHILRQDPDIVLVGETRDLETAEIAIRASLTGHLVFTTLHTNDALGAVLRLVDMGVESFLVASCLRAALAQRLVRRLCSSCRRATRPDSVALSGLGPLGEALEGKETWEPVGCSDCLEGYKGRVGLFELMKMGSDLQDRIRAGDVGMDRLREGKGGPVVNDLLTDGIAKILAGVTSLSEVKSVVA